MLGKCQEVKTIGLNRLICSWSNCDKILFDHSSNLGSTGSRNNMGLSTTKASTTEGPPPGNTSTATEGVATTVT